MSAAPRTVAPSPQATGAVRRSRSEIRALTGLRIVAAVWVVLYHYEPELAPYVDQLPGTHAVLSAGWIGVELFFVLSGFVIARGYLAECGRRWSTAGAARFVANRFARVWPAWATVTLLACAWFVTADLIGLRGRVADLYPPIDVVSLVRQLTMTQMWGRDDLVGSSYVGPGWSISAEWLAYVTFPVLALLLRHLLRLPWMANLVLAVALTAPLAVPSFLHGTSDVEMDWVLRIACSFVAGVVASCATADLEDTELGRRWGRRLVATALVTVAVVLLWANWRTGQDLLVSDRDPGRYPAVAVVAWPLLVAGLAMSDSGPARFLSRDVLVYGGRISYCLYLTHALVRDIGLGVVWHEPAEAGVRTPGVVLLVPVLVALSFASAVALHHGVEEPARRRLVRLWNGRRTAPAVARSRSAGSPVPAGGGRPATTRSTGSLPVAPARPWPLAGPPRPRTVPTSGRPTDPSLVPAVRRDVASRG
jgi:peptidoglycan/LPS O-acetylase OafA/YrhL